MVVAFASQLFWSKSHCLTDSALAWNAQITHCWRHPTICRMTECVSIADQQTKDKLNPVLQADEFQADTACDHYCLI